MHPVRIGLVGGSGYARTHLQYIQALEREGLAELVSVTILATDNQPQLEQELSSRGVSVRRSFGEMLETDGAEMELVAIPTSIHTHAALMIQAADAGLNVLLEKPPAATIQDLNAMFAALKQAGTFCAVGFQSQWNPSVLGLKRLICDNGLGPIREVVAVGNWRHLDDYYQRNSWAGRFMADERYVLDGTMNNPFAHLLFNALYFASPKWAAAATPVTVRAELYRGHRIESEDTACVKITCEEGARVYFYGSLCAGNEETLPAIEVKGENGRAVWEWAHRARVFRGEQQTHEITDNGVDPRLAMFRNVVYYLRGKDRELNCPLEMTRPHVLAVNGAFESARRPVAIPEKNLHTYTCPQTGQGVTEILPEMVEISNRAAAERKLYSDMDVAWAVKTEPFSLEGYSMFNLRLPTG